MKRIKARESGATDLVIPFGCSVELVTDATREHEAREAKYAYRVMQYGWARMMRETIEAVHFQPSRAAEARKVY